MQSHQIDLGYVLGNTLSDMSWTGFTFTCALAMIMLMWCVLPFAVFGVKRRLDGIESAQRQQTELLAAELRRANEILARRAGGAAPATTVDPWHAVPTMTEAAGPAAPAPRQPLSPVIVQATQPNQTYTPYSDDPRPAPPVPRRELRWSRVGQQGAGGSAA